MFEQSNDINYICDVIDGMESLMLSTENKNSRYNRELVRSILDTNGYKANEVAGCEGFGESFKKMVETVWTSIKNFFKGIWDSLFSSKEDSKDQKTKIDEIKKAATVPAVVEGMKGVPLLENKDKMKGIYQSYRSAMDDLSKSLKEQKFQNAVGSKTITVVNNLVKTADKAMNAVEESLSQDPSVIKWTQMALDQYKDIDQAIAAAEIQWKAANSMIDEIKKEMNGITDGMSEAERKEAIDALNQMKNRFRLLGQVLAAVVQNLKRMKMAMDSNLKLVHKKVIALEHKKAA